MKTRHRGPDIPPDAAASSSRGVARIACAAVLLLLSLPGAAETIIDASATTQYESNSNVFTLQPGYTPFGATDTRRNDATIANSARIWSNFIWGQQKLFATLTGTDFKYDHYTNLNHSDYNADGQFDWRLGQALDGILEVSRSRKMIPFTNVNVPLLSLQSEQRQSGEVRFRFSPSWRIDFDGYHRTVDEPLLGAPNLQLRETSAQAALKFVGGAGLTAGLSATHLIGDFTGFNGSINPSYSQNTTEFVLIHEAADKSQFTGRGGYTRRSSTVGLGKVSGATGDLDYVRRFGGKTSVELGFSRAVSSYIANTGTEIDTIAMVNLNYQATYKTGLAIGYNWTSRLLPLQGNAPLGSDRRDHLQYTTLTINYDALRWLLIRPYASIQTRSSNYIGGNFNATVVGIYATVRWRNKAFR